MSSPWDTRDAQPLLAVLKNGRKGWKRKEITERQKHAVILRKSRNMEIAGMGDEDEAGRYFVCTLFLLSFFLPFLISFFLFETGSHYVLHAGFELIM